MRLIFRHQDHAPLSRMDVRLKIGIGAALSVGSVLIDSVASLGILALIGMLICWCARPNRLQIRVIVTSALFLVWGVMFSQGLFYSEFPRTVWIRILPQGTIFKDGLCIYAEGVRHGLVQSLRMITMVLTGYAICFTTEPDRFFRGLVAMRIPFALSFMAVTAIRFIPVAAQEFSTVRTAMRLKGYVPFRNGLRDTLVTEVASLRPVLAGTIRRSQEVALSIVTRGFSLDHPRTSLHSERLNAADWILLWILLFAVLFLTGCKLLFWLYQQEFYYSTDLRVLYQFVRDWL